MMIDLDAKDLAQILWALDNARGILNTMPESLANSKRKANLNALIDKLRAHERNMP